MHRTPQEHRDEFQDLGYTVFEGVLSADEFSYAQEVFDEVLNEDTKPPVIYEPIRNARRQMNYLHCEPRLSKFGHHPRVLEAVGGLFDRPFRLDHTPTPTALFQGEAGGLPGVPGKWGGHLDWPSKPPTPSEINGFANGILHFTTLEPGYGCFTLVPRSHKVVESYLDDPDMLDRMYRSEFHDFPGLEPEMEITANAGDLLFFHPLLVHGASDNLNTRTRKVLHAIFRAVDVEPADGPVKSLERFHPKYVTCVDDDLQWLLGPVPASLSNASQGDIEWLMGPL